MEILHGLKNQKMLKRKPLKHLLQYNLWCVCMCVCCVCVCVCPRSYSKSETGTKYNAHYSDNDDDEEGHHGCSIGVMEVGGEQEEQLLFSGSNLPPVQLPLDYSLHTKHRAVVTKNKCRSFSSTTTSIDLYM